jgi:hypothetical protein
MGSRLEGGKVKESIPREMDVGDSRKDEEKEKE